MVGYVVIKIKCAFARRACVCVRDGSRAGPKMYGAL